jgi:DNA excision repair protein ERCC-3
MVYEPANPLIVQGDYTLLVEVDSPRYAEARDALAAFAELVKSPEHVHTYRVTPLSVWNAASAGVRADWIVDTLFRFSKYDVPQHVLVQVRDWASRYGRLRIHREDSSLVLEAVDEALAEEVARFRDVQPYVAERLGPVQFRVDPAQRGRLKLALTRMGYPAEDLAGYVTGEALAIALRDTTLEGLPFGLRHYQRESVDAFHQGGGVQGGSGVVVLPCGAGKTVVGIGVMSAVSASTLVLATSTTAVRQWIGEIVDKSTVTREMISEYTGESKEIKPVTVSTYQILTHRKRKDDPFTHFRLFDERNWGLIIYDEVHLLPAPVFQATAQLQARRRLGLTATLVREDNKEEDVFALIGPKKYDVPWKVLEHQGWIAKAVCTEVRLRLPDALRMTYAVAEKRDKFRVASENPDKIAIAQKLIRRHAGTPTLVIGMYLDQLQRIATALNAPILTGQTQNRRREDLYDGFRRGDVPVLVVSKVANFAVDLPDAAVAIQISGTFGSRQEEAQRLGRILRPKPGENQAHFYSIVTRDTVEQDFALNRQLFLTEQGYQYAIADAGEIV